jgi:hypothetical protein
MYNVGERLSQKVREWLMLLQLFDQTTHEDRLEIDREIESRTGINCDYAISRRLISEQEFQEIVATILNRKKSKRKEVVLETESYVI